MPTRPVGPSARRRPWLVVTLTLLSSLTLGGTLVGCGSSGPDDAGASSTTSRSPGPLASDDIDRLAQVLFRNYTDGGATVAVAFDYSAELSVRVTGDVDLADHTGRLEVTSTFADGRPQEQTVVVFEDDAVYEQPTADDELDLAAEGRTGIEWLRRAPDRAGHPLDQVIQLLVSLAATRPDNPQLLAQGDLTFEGQEDVGGSPADVYRSAKGTTYWLDADTDRLVRFQATLDGFAGPVVIELIDPGPRTVAIPTGADVADRT